MNLPVVEIFRSMQGEGANTGKPVVFVRLGRCNLACPWCDTDFSVTRPMPPEAIADAVDECSDGVLAVVVTGGEPTVHPGLPELLRELKDRGYWLALETNGVNAPDAESSKLLDYVAVSPKAMYAELYDDEKMATKADEVRIVADGDIEDFCANMRSRISARHYFISPCERDGVMDVATAVALLGRLNSSQRANPWLLSLQTHKLAGFR